MILLSYWELSGRLNAALANEKHDRLPSDTQKNKETGLGVWLSGRALASMWETLDSVPNAEKIS